jgi:hypothetical protein
VFGTPGTLTAVIYEGTDFEKVYRHLLLSGTMLTEVF